MSEKNNQAYWRANLRLMLLLLVIWFSVSFLAGIIFVDFLNQFHLYGYKLGFWFAQQGSIFTFVLLIFYYSNKNNLILKKSFLN